MPTARSYAGATTTGGAIFVLGGYDGSQALAANEVYFPPSDKGDDTPWEVRAPLPEARQSVGVASLADIIYVIGGIGVEGDLPWLEYSGGEDRWQSLDHPFSVSLSGPGVVASGSYVFVMGGRVDSGFSSQTMAYKAVFTILLPPLP